MTWSENRQGRCNNPACQKEIWWNERIRHPNTGRPRPLDEPYLPDHNPKEKLHLCMTQKRPQHFMRKYNDASYFDQFPSWFLTMMGNRKK